MARAAHACLLGCLAGAAVAHAEPADHRSAAELYAAASAAFGELRYGDSVGLIERAWRRGDSGPAQLRALFALAGRATASMGRDTAAELWFQRWLCLEPAAELPAGASPKLQVLLSRARDALGGAALALRAVRHGDRVELTIRDPLALAASVRAGGTRTPLASAHVTVAAARGDVELLDPYGNVLASSAVDPDPPPALRAPALPAPPAVTPDPPWQARWSSWAIAGAGLGLVSVAAWWIADDADAQARDSGDESEESALRRRRDVATWVSRGALVGVGVAVTAGIIIYVRGEHRISAAPQPGGASVAWRVRF
ncbi:MAG TPA: hypothetical protein VGD37_32480 [Kofleriaceae bacterium]|jgi:hypothetical protein